MQVCASHLFAGITLIWKNFMPSRDDYALKSFGFPFLVFVRKCASVQWASPFFSSGPINVKIFPRGLRVLVMDS
jgi:hypothetical protein